MSVESCTTWKEHRYGIKIGEDYVKHLNGRLSANYSPLQSLGSVEYFDTTSLLDSLYCECYSSMPTPSQHHKPTPPHTKVERELSLPYQRLEYQRICHTIRNLTHVPFTWKLFMLIHKYGHRNPPPQTPYYLPYLAYTPLEISSQESHPIHTSVQESLT